MSGNYDSETNKSKFQRVNFFSKKPVTIEMIRSNEYREWLPRTRFLRTSKSFLTIDVIIIQLLSTSVQKSHSTIIILYKREVVRLPTKVTAKNRQSFQQFPFPRHRFLSSRIGEISKPNSSISDRENRKVAPWFGASAARIGRNR